MFVDLDGFTEICAQEPVEAAFELVCAFQRHIAVCLGRTGGTLHRCLGDGAMTTFGTATADASCATRALRCARTILARVAMWNRVRRRRGLRSVSVSIGAQYGDIVLGRTDAAGSADVSVIGDPVNVASRLEGIARTLGAAMVTTEDLVARVAQESGAGAPELAGLARLGARLARGRTAPVAVWLLPLADA